MPGKRGRVREGREGQHCAHNTCIWIRVLGLLSRQRLMVSARAAFLMGSKAMR